jgi:anti-anti-sigma regulatory factor
LRDVTFVDCAGASVLVEATDRAVRETVRLRILPSRALHRLSTLLGLAEELDLLDDRR